MAQQPKHLLLSHLNCVPPSFFSSSSSSATTTIDGEPFECNKLPFHEDVIVQFIIITIGESGWLVDRIEITGDRWQFYSNKKIFANPERNAELS